MKNLFINTVTRDTIRKQMEDYFAADEPDFSWTILSSTPDIGSTYIEAEVTSLRFEGEVWKHFVAMAIPNTQQTDGAYIIVDGGNVVNGVPQGVNPTDPTYGSVISVLKGFSAFAGIVTAFIRQVPPTPIFGTTHENDFVNAVIEGYEFNRDPLWNPFLPMGKALMQGFTAIQEICLQEKSLTVTKYAPVGLSKRGYTCYMAAGFDSRVNAAIPVVVDQINIPETYRRRIEVYGENSMNLPQAALLNHQGYIAGNMKPLGRKVIEASDPYYFREKLTMPLYIILATNDPWFPIDAAKFYIKDLGDAQLAYQMNIGHDFNLEYVKASLFWYNNITKGVANPELTWTSTEDSSKITVNITVTNSSYSRVRLIKASSSDEIFSDKTWTATNLSVSGNNFQVEVNKPTNGYEAFYIEVNYNTVTGFPFPPFDIVDHTICTRAYIL